MNAKSLFMAVILTLGVALPASSQTPDLVGTLAKELGSTPQQAQGAAGSLFKLAQSKLKPEDWTKVAGAVPGMDSLLKAAPGGAVGTSGIPGASSLAGLADVSSAFSKLGLKPELVAKAIPVLTSFVSKSGGAEVGKLLANALK
jgi:hypothetical protein